MSACFSVAPSHVFLSLFYCPSLLFSNSHLCVHCSVILHSDLLVFTSSLFWTTLIADMMLLSFLFLFYDGRSSLSDTQRIHRCHLALHARQATWIMSTNRSWMDVCASVLTVDTVFVCFGGGLGSVLQLGHLIGPLA